ncbi:atpD, partial [Symbiodinium necroappetens]
EDAAVMEDILKIKAFYEDEAVFEELSLVQNDFNLTNVERADKILDMVKPLKSTVTPKFVRFLAKKMRLKGLKAICLEYVQSAYFTESVSPVKVTSAARLTDEQKSKIIEKMKVKCETSNIKLIEEIDANLISGFKLEWGYIDPVNLDAPSHGVDLSLQNILNKKALQVGGVGARMRSKKGRCSAHRLACLDVVGCRNRSSTSRWFMRPTEETVELLENDYHQELNMTSGLRELLLLKRDSYLQRFVSLELSQLCSQFLAKVGLSVPGKQVALTVTQPLGRLFTDARFRTLVQTMARFAVKLAFASIYIASACDGSGEECPQTLSFLQIALESDAMERRESSKKGCPTPEEASGLLAGLMPTVHNLTEVEVLEMCAQLPLCVDSTTVATQNAWAQAGAIDFVAAALNEFPVTETVVIACTMAMAPLILFNRENGLHAGKLGGLNVTLNYYGSHLDSLLVMDLGGAIGAYFDFVNENRAIARELGGVEMFIQNIRNNFHGQYSDWAVEPVKQSLYALSSGTWTNGDIAYHEGFPSLGVQLMKEHGNETKIAEETLQAVKAMAFESDLYRSRWSDLGIFEVLPGVLYDNPTDQGAISLVCEATQYVMGSDQPLGDPVSAIRIIPFNASIQEQATKGKMLEALLATAMSDADLVQFDHESFNFNLDLAYPAKRNCFGALLLMGK